MAEIKLEDLGLSTEEIAERVIDRTVDGILRSEGMTDEDGRSVRGEESAFAKKVKAAVVAKIDKAVEDIAAAHVLPNITTYVENLTMQATNSWGEKTGVPITFRDYLVQRAEKWITEPVNYEGKSKGKDSYNWSPSQTRIAHMIHAHLQYNIDTAIKGALKDLNSNIAKGLADAVKIKLESALAGLKTTTTVP